jgi:histidinol dehydrogenase
MKVLQNPDRNLWPEILQRPVLDAGDLEKQVRTVMQAVRENGDHALREYTRRFDGVSLEGFRVSDDELKRAKNLVPDELRQSIETAAENIRRFHAAQLKEEAPVETANGIRCWRRSVAIDKVGLYIPGGTAPLFSTVLMLGIPARLAGCGQTILCTPPARDGSVNPAILFAAEVAGISEIYKLGGAQAIAAFTYGTESIPGVDKIFGPGNQYVTCAKQLAQMQGTAIDMPAGPSEVCVLADHTANPAWVAADLLSQAEHGADSQVLLATTDPSLPQKVADELATQILKLPRKDMAALALGNSKAVVYNDAEELLALVNEYAAEHLIIACDEPEKWADRIRNAGSVFLGHHSPESVGDYASGTNHTLPTNGFARAYSGVSVDSFVKKITYQQLTPEGLAGIAGTVTTMALAEGLDAHARAVAIRLK